MTLERADVVELRAERDAAKRIQDEAEEQGDTITYITQQDYLNELDEAIAKWE